MKLVAVFVACAACLMASFVAAAAPLAITTLSTRADSVTGGDVLVRIDYPAGQRLPLWVTLNDKDVTGQFRTGTAANTWMGLVSGLSLGNNTLRVRTKAPAGDVSLQIINHPITGPVFSGPHEQPFYCMTQNFPVPGSTQRLGPALDADCSTTTRVDYVYRSTANSFKQLPLGAGYPSDLKQTTTSLGKTVPYIVRVETGTINRAIYQTAILHDPLSEPTPSWQVPPIAWNQRLVYTLGGGCVGGWYIQGTSIGNGGILEDLMLRQGYAVASSTLNVFGNNCQEVLAAESLMMVKERFIENFGPPVFTIGYGCSGGSEQAHPISDDYPGLLDGIVVGCSFPELTAGITFPITDADLFLHYLNSQTSLTWTPAQIIAATGFPTTTTLNTIGPGNAVRTKAQGGSCNAAIPTGTRFDQVTNPTGVRCDIYDHMVNIWGRDPATGYARRTLDNVGIQYGLGALNSGAISTTQFIELNQKIGGYDNNGNFVTSRSVGDLTAIQIGYQTGRVTYTGQGLATVPIIDYRGYVDQPENGNEVHARFHSFSLRARLLAVNGNFDNQVMLVEDGVSPGSNGLFSDSSPVLSHALTQMDQWLTSLFADTSNASIHDKIVHAKPVDLVDACFTGNGTNKIVEPQVYSGNTTCNSLYPAFSTPRMVAGEPLANNVLKCQLKAITASDYSVTFTPAEMGQLASIFPQGVCDYTKPGVEQTPPVGTWITFDQ